MNDHLEQALHHLQAIYDANFETDADGDSTVIDDKLRRKLNSILDKVRSLQL